MKNSLKLLTILAIAFAGCSLMARPGPDHRHDDRGHGGRGGNDGIRLAADIIDLVGVSLDLINPRPVYVQQPVVYAPPVIQQPVIYDAPVIQQPIVYGTPVIQQPVVVSPVVRPIIAAPIRPPVVVSPYRRVCPKVRYVSYPRNPCRYR